jgi:hypothetical protein
MDMTYIHRFYNMFLLIKPLPDIWVQGRPARKADNITAICKPIV